MNQLRILVSFILWLDWLFMAFLGLFLCPVGIAWCLYVSKTSHFPFLLWPWDNYNDGIFGTAGQPYPGWKAYIWTALRNPCSTWGKLALGRSIPKNVTTVGDTSILQSVKAGSYWAYGDNTWEYRLTYPYTFFGPRCFNIRIGWKLMGNAAPTASFVFRISPFNVRRN